MLLAVFDFAHNELHSLSDCTLQKVIKELIVLFRLMKHLNLIMLGLLLKIWCILWHVSFGEKIETVTISANNFQNGQEDSDFQMLYSPEMIKILIENQLHSNPLNCMCLHIHSHILQNYYNLSITTQKLFDV